MNQEESEKGFNPKLNRSNITPKSRELLNKIRNTVFEFNNAVPNTKEESNSNYIRADTKLNFDGRHLTGDTYYITEDNDTIGHRQFREQSYSGRKKNGRFDLSHKRQATVGEGPIPEGNYYINPQKIYYRTTEGFDAAVNYIGHVPSLIGLRKLGNHPGGKDAWGAGHIDINPKSVNVNYNGKDITRSGFTIHGSSVPGSAGCIDLVDKDQKFFDYLNETKWESDSIPLRVDYSKYRDDKF